MQRAQLLHSLHAGRGDPSLRRRPPRDGVRAHLGGQQDRPAARLQAGGLAGRGRRAGIGA